MKTPLITFIIMLLLCAFIAWCGGYNFDHRGASVELGMTCSLVMSGLAAAFAWYIEQILKK